MEKPTPFDIALQLENDGINFYTDCAERTKSPIAKQLFIALIKDEERHVEFIKQLKNGLAPDNNASKSKFRDRIVTIFTTESANSKKESAINAVDLDSLRIAADMELRGITFYEDYIEQCPDATERRIFRALAEEEKNHYQAIFNTKLYYDNPGDWFMVDENWHFDGGGIGA